VKDHAAWAVMSVEC